MQRRTYLLLGVGVVLLVSGCVAPLTGGDADPGAITDRVESRIASIDTFEGTMHLTTETGNETLEITAEVAYRAPNRVNFTYVEPSSLAGTHVLSNGSTITFYVPGSDSVVVRNATGRARSATASDRSGLFLGLDGVENATFEGNETLAGGDAVELSYAVDESEVSLLLAGGQRTSRLSETNGDDVNVTVWVDRDRWLPLKAQMNFTGFEEPINYTVQYENVTVGASLPDRRFELDTEGARRAESTLGAMLPENGTNYSDYDALAADAGPGLPPETLPANSTFQRGFAIDDPDASFYQLVYAGGTGVIQVQYITENVSIVESDDAVTVDGRPVATTEMQQAKILEYHCEDLTYLLIGADRATLLDGVEAIGCP